MLHAALANAFAVAIAAPSASCDAAEVFLKVGSVLTQDLELVLETRDGSTTVSLTAGTTYNAARIAISQASQLIFLSAGAGDNDELINPFLRLHSQRIGADQFVCVKAIHSDGEPVLFESITDREGDDELCDTGVDGIAGDLTCDGVVGEADLWELWFDGWGSTTYGAADLNHDGIVDAFDLSTLLALWSEE